jgi:hypothetical protein
MLQITGVSKSLLKVWSANEAFVESKDLGLQGWLMVFLFEILEALG